MPHHASLITHHPSPSSAALLEWLPVIAGLLVLYVPTFYDLAGTLWQQDEFAHGPIILAIVLWLIWQKRQALFPTPAPTEALSASTFVIPAPDHSIRGQAPAGIQNSFVIPAKAGIRSVQNATAPVSGFVVPVFGLLLYAVGRSQDK